MSARGRRLAALAAALMAVPAASLGLVPARAAAATTPPAPVPLDRGWTMSAAGGPARPVTLPRVLDARSLPSLFSGESGTYQLRLTPPPLPPGFRWALRFDQVRRTARVALDGRLLGVHTDPYVGFTLPAPGLTPGRPHELVVAVDSHKGYEPREGWWNWAGITEPVTLVPQGPVVLHDLGLMPALRCDAGGACADARVTVDGWLENRTAASVRPRLEVTLRPPGGSGPVTRAVLDAPSLASGATRRFTATVRVAGSPQLWAPGHPDRYAATVRTLAGTTVSQVDRMKIGLRQVAVRHGHLTLNGRRVQLRGASIQQDAQGHGAALTGADIARIVAELRAVHADVTRAQYLLDPRLLDALDAAGILVWTQAPIYHRDVLLRTPAERAAALATVRGTVLGARSHPSTLVMSVANELSSTPGRDPGTEDFMRAAVPLVRDLDPAIPVAVDLTSYPNLPYVPVYRHFDALGLNSYFGWYAGKAGARSTASPAGLAPYLRGMHRFYPHQSLVVTEFGAEATENGPADEKQTYAFQSAYLRRTLAVVARQRFVDGAIYFPLRDFAVKPHWDGLLAHPRPGIATDSIHNKGLIAYDGAPKPAFSLAARLFAATPLFSTPAGRILAWSLLVAGALLTLLWLALLRTWLTRRREARRRGPGGIVVPLWGEADGDDVAVGHDVVAAFEA